MFLYYKVILKLIKYLKFIKTLERPSFFVKINKGYYLHLLLLSLLLFTSHHDVISPPPFYKYCTFYKIINKFYSFDLWSASSTLYHNRSSLSKSIITKNKYNRKWSISEKPTITLYVINFNMKISRTRFIRSFFYVIVNLKKSYEVVKIRKINRLSMRSI